MYDDKLRRFNAFSVFPPLISSPHTDTKRSASNELICPCQTSPHNGSTTMLLSHTWQSLGKLTISGGSSISLMDDTLSLALEQCGSGIRKVGNKKGHQ